MATYLTIGTSATTQGTINSVLRLNNMRDDKPATATITYRHQDGTLALTNTIDFEPGITPARVQQPFACLMDPSLDHFPAALPLSRASLLPHFTSRRQLAMPTPPSAWYKAHHWDLPGCICRFWSRILLPQV